MTRLAPVLSAVFLLAIWGCGHNGGSGDDAGGNGDGGGTNGDGGNTIDSNPNAPDAPPGAGSCSASQPQCNNCVDDDGDNMIDGNDPECTGAIDNDESSFATGIPGDNIDSKNQDCYFDGNSGAGDDGCNTPTCCILGYTTQQCHDAGLGNNFDPATDCPAPTQFCIDNCQPLVPPGCDCFGCCTICDASGCVDIIVNPAVDPNCTYDNPDVIHDPTQCFTCVQNTECGSSCDPTAPTCVLCPGQDPGDLDPNCNGMTSCPSGEAVCDPTTNPCPDPTTQFCDNGCCVAVVQ